MAPPVIDLADRLSRLPDEVLAHILSFLPAQEAVGTCVLARTWRDVWKFTRRLRIMGANSKKDVREFVDHLLRFRLNGLECASLDECEIMFGGDYLAPYDVNNWIRHSLECQVQALRVEDAGLHFYLVMSDMPLISRHLTRLELCGICFECTDLNLDGCPALEHLEITNCVLPFLRKIMSPSIKRLVITGCESNGNPRRFKISAPGLVSLWLEIGKFRPPLLESMPELVEAYVNIDSYRDINCECGDPMGCYHSTPPSYISDGENTEDYPGPNTEGCVLLEGLSQAKHLVLLAHNLMSFQYIFSRDLRMCPTFSNLKTLVLNGYWCEPADCRALACILEHAPVLENLTVIFSEEVELKYGIVMEACPDATAKSTMTTQCLKTVKIKCHTVHEGVQNVLNFFSTELRYGILMEGHPDTTAKSTMMTTQCPNTVKVKCHTVHEGAQNVLKFLSTLNICFNSDRRLHMKMKHLSLKSMPNSVKGTIVLIIVLYVCLVLFLY